MKKKISFFSFTALFFFLNMSQLFAKDFENYKIYNSKGKEENFGKIIKASKDKSHIFFGEYHDNAVSHWLQLELTEALFSIHNTNLVLGAEMFEADNQFIMDEYLKDYISPKNFQAEMRLWPNYNTDYKPLVEFAKANQLKFIATNIPRRYANMVYKNGVESLDKLSDLAKQFFVPLNQFTFDSTVACYKNMLIEMSHGGINMAKAQAIKDATMSYFILQNTKPNTVFLHYNGAYHSDHYEGIVYYLKQKIDVAKILTISTVTQEDISQLSEENLGKADFIICVKSNMTSTH